jgi:hypothetical protein
VKPLVRLGEREMAAYCVLRGIDYIVEECPMAVGNKHLGYKEALNEIEARSPGSKHDFYFGFLARASARFADAAPADGDPEGEGTAVLGVLRTVRRPHHVGRLRLLPAHREVGGRPARHLDLERNPAVTDAAPDRRFRVGEEILLIDRKKRRYLVTLEEGGEFHTHSGFLHHADHRGSGEGAVVRSSRGATFTTFRPTLSDFVLKMPRGAQVIYPKDLGPILMLADIFPGRPRPRSPAWVRAPSP